MTNIKRNYFAIPAVAIAALLASTAAFAQLDSTRLTSDISLVVDASADLSVVPLIADSPESDLLTYDLAANEIQFTAGVVAPDYDEPLFCFDIGGAQSAVGIRVTDPNGHLIVRDFAVEDSLDYVLGSSSSLLIRPAADQQCFWRSAQGVFGLFGQTSTNDSVPADTIMRNRFEVEHSLSLEYQGVPEFVTLGETISYQLVVTNTGNGNLNEVALQELFPENLGVYSAGLQDTSWSCAATGDAVCPVSSLDPKTLRFKDVNSGGVDITPGDSLTFTIERTVNANSIAGGSIRLHAGVVADPVATGTPFAVDEALMTAVGASAGLDVSGTDAVADGSSSSSITVSVLDSSGNPVPDETVDFVGVSPVGSLNVTPSSGVTNSNGKVVFNSGSTTVADDYTVEFSAGTLTGSGTLTFTHGPAAQLYVNANNAEAVSDGADAIAVTALVEDANGNPVDSVAVDVVNNGGLTSLPSQEFTNIDGLATFTATSTDTGVYELEFSVSGAGNGFATVEFVAGDPNDLEFTQQPSNVIGDLETPISPAPALRVVDVNSNLVSDDSSTNVQLSLVDSTGATVISGLEFGTVTNGEIQFSNLTFDSSLVGTGYKIKAVGDWTDGSGTTHFFGVTSTSFDILSP